MAQINGRLVLSADVVMPLIGAWHARASVGHNEVISGAVEFDLERQALSGTVTRSGLNSGRLELAIVGGAGGLSTEVKAKHYNAPTAGQVLADLMRLSGETLATSVAAGLLGTDLPSWHRPAAPVSHCLTLLTDELGVNWRVLGDGTIWIGEETWPEESAAHTLIDESWTDGVLTVAMAPPVLRPGVTFRGQRIEQVTHWLASGELRTEAQLTSPRGLLDRFLAPLRRRIDYSRLYPARVAAQNANQTLQLVPDDDVIKGAGLDRVQMRFGIPGIVKATVTPGTRCQLGFAAGDPSRPFACNFEMGSVLEISIESPAVALGANTAAAIPLNPGSASQPTPSVRFSPT